MSNKIIDERFNKKMEEWGIDAKTIKKCINKRMSKKSKSSRKFGALQLSADKPIKRKIDLSIDKRDETIQMINDLLILKDIDKQPFANVSESTAKKKNEKILKPKLGNIPSENFYSGGVTSKKSNKRK